MDRGRLRAAGAIAVALAVAAVALRLRFSITSLVLTPGGVIFPETDPFYHARRILLTLHHFPHVPQFDAYVNFPEGARIIWPVGFDLAMASLAALSGAAHDPERAVRVCAAAIPFLALLGIGATGLLALRVAGPLAGVCAAGLLAIFPFEVSYSVVGRVDHQVLEPLFLSLALWTFLRAAGAVAPRARDAWAIACGAVMALGFWFITTALLVPVLLAAGIAAAITLEAAGLREEEGLTRPAILAFGSGSFFLVPFVLGSSFGRAGEFSYLGLSWLHESEMLLAALAVPTLRWLLLPGVRLRRKALALGVCAALLLTIGMFHAPAGSGWRETIATVRDAASFIFRKDPVVVSVAESESVWSAPFFDLARQLTPWLFWSPVLWAALLLESRRRRFKRAEDVVLLTVFLLAFGLFLLQIRFSILLGVPLAVLGGIGIDRAVRAARERKGLALATGTILVALATIPAVARPLSRESLARLRAVPDATVQTYRWIRYHTPPTRGYDDPVVKPEYGILAAWGEGHALTYFAHRANIANPFGQAPWHVRGAVRAATILMETDPERAAAACDALSVRYVVLKLSGGEILSLALVARGKENPFVRVETDASGNRRLKLLDPYYETLHGRLAVSDGAMITIEGRTLPAVPGFRLVRETPEAGFPVQLRGWPAPITPSFMKVFERVQGARLQGPCHPGELVEAVVQVGTNVGRRFIYSTAAPCGGSGRFELRVPYAHSVTGDTGAVGAYRIRNGARNASVLVTESDVEEGRAIGVKGWSGGGGAG